MIRTSKEPVYETGFLVVVVNRFEFPPIETGLVRESVVAILSNFNIIFKPIVLVYDTVLSAFWYGYSMNLDEKIERSKSTERIDFSRYQPMNIKSPLVKIASKGKLIVEPYWTLEDDWEGKRYADYIAENPEYDGVYARREVAERLETAASSLPENFKIVIRAGHRPIEVQRKLLIECAQDYKDENPGVTDNEALEHARDFVSDPEITLPPHVCGAAVDVELVHAESGRLVDFGTKMNDDNEKSYLHYTDLTVQQKNNRMALLAAMLDAGFASLKTEWWHFSYGDQIWAWFYGEEQSLFSPVDL